MYILVVDDDQFANALVKFVLVKEGYEVETLESPRNAMPLIQRREPDLLLLDITMPYIDGFEFSTRLRAEGYETPIIFITARDSIDDKLQGFKIGADDYICKPYIHQELVARVQAVTRRTRKNGNIGNQSQRIGPFELYPSELKVVKEGHPAVSLTPKEMHVLSILMNHAGIVVKREQMLSGVWNDNENNSNIVDVYIRRLRTKLEANPQRPQHILSVRGVGYKFVLK